MSIAELAAAWPEPSRRIVDVLQEWQVTECSTLVREMGLLAAGDALATTAIVGDALRGGSAFDNIARIPKPVQDAFEKLMKVRPGDYDRMRELLLEHVTVAGNGSLSFDESSVIGFINKLKGQIGENVFVEHVGSAAQLAQSGSQAGWDVAVRQSDGAFQYVQVKLYGDATGVVRHMKSVQQRLMDGVITGVDEQSIDHIYFAVPESIHADVQRLVGGDPRLASMLYETPVPIDSQQAAKLVQAGITNVSQSQLSQFFQQLLGGAAVAGSLHAAVNAFLWYKGSKEFADAVADTVADTAISTVGIAVGLAAECLCRTVVISSVVGIGARMLLGHVTRSRWDFGEFLEHSITETRSHIAHLHSCGVPQPAA